MMALRSRLDEIIAERQTTMYAVARDSGLSYQTVHSLAKNQTKRIDLETIEKICAALDTTISDIFVHTPKETETPTPR